jgi:hypothetical protein
MKLDPAIWGPHYWFFLHTLAFCYPIKPSDPIKKRYYELLQNFDLYIPHPQVASYYRYLLHIYPLKPYLDKKEDLVKWVWHLHNKVNDKMEKKRVTLEEFYESYHKKYATPPEEAAKLRYVKYALLALSLAVCLYFVYSYYGGNR